MVILFGLEGGFKLMKYLILCKSKYEVNSIISKLTKKLELSPHHSFKLKKFRKIICIDDKDDYQFTINEKRIPKFKGKIIYGRQFIPAVEFYDPEIGKFSVFKDYLIVSDRFEYSVNLWCEFIKKIRTSNTQIIYKISRPDLSVEIINGDRFRFISENMRDKKTRGFRGFVLSDKIFSDKLEYYIPDGTDSDSGQFNIFLNILPMTTENINGIWTNRP